MRDQMAAMGGEKRQKNTDDYKVSLCVGSVKALFSASLLRLSVKALWEGSGKGLMGAQRCARTTPTTTSVVSEICVCVCVGLQY
jgi:hypothetical protein